MPTNKPQSKKEKELTIHPETSQLQYGESLAVSLVLYTQLNADFQRILEKRISSLPKHRAAETSLQIPKGLELLLPFDIHRAERRAEWLIKSIEDNSIPGAQRAAAILATYTQPQPLADVRQLIIGIIGFAIPGITLGLITKRKESMTVIVRTERAKKPTLTLTRMVSHASLSVLARAFEIADGNAHKLEPEVADWFFSDRNIVLYEADSHTLMRILGELRVLDIKHATIQEHGDPAVLAISPVVHNTYQFVRWKLKPLTR